MRNKKDSTGVIIVLMMVILIIILSGYIVYQSIKYTMIKEEFKEFMKFQIELTMFITDEYDLNYNETIDKFLKYKVNEILNNVSSKAKEIKI